MRVIAGSARRLMLKTPQGFDTRPTSDKVKETLFNILAPYIYSDTGFLDLYAGSGGIGIEALSRGAGRAVFVEKGREAVACIKENLKTTRFEDKASVMNMDVLSALNRLEGHEKFGLVFMDPPYNNEYEKDVLDHLSRSTLLDEDAIIVVEADNTTDFDYLDEMGYEVVKYKKYKNNCHVFLRRSC
ncbi:MAG TPA: 16S rRNA (guanine(966)-N(2))-methyltransferase RsmD [Lachnospiraceae bacterium]|nr:16S rRNA (guanine(966)-N(2))-methyltransferase RsmD [Lachnospiraceae bacterium]